ncbi:DUF5685 family protein [Streptacidiphilus cavernicola]|uniref:DUF5685 family protein n=1 Tax=Streptacidiphilus cavernicola TaxID=3342716 RepID=A0ABV6VZ19_9ACTN
MFGIIRPCRHRLTEQLHRSWTAHLCGLCLALRDDHGQLARTATNYDALVVSVLVEAQVGTGGSSGPYGSVSFSGSSVSPSSVSGRRTAGPCPLRGMRTASVAHGEGARLAAAVSLALASAKVRDHVADGDGAYARRPVALTAGGIADRWGRQSRRGGTALGFDTGLLFETLGRQTALEQAAGLGTSVLLVTAPTEEATALALAHTAVLAGRPSNSAPLAEIGRLFGRLAHLLDAVEDLTEDQATGAWNPLAATGTSLAEAQRLCDDAVHGVRLALRDVEFTDGALAHRLLAHETAAAVRRTFGHAGIASPAASTAATAPAAPPTATAPVAPTEARQVGYPQDPNNGGRDKSKQQRPTDPFTSYRAAGPFGPGDSAPPRRRNPLAGCAMWTLLCCTCQACCRDDYEDPCNGRRRQGPCSDLDCCDTCDLNCCEALECCECCECCDCGC